MEFKEVSKILATHVMHKHDNDKGYYMQILGITFKSINDKVVFTTRKQLLNAFSAFLNSTTGNFEVENALIRENGCNGNEPFTVFETMLTNDEFARVLFADLNIPFETIKETLIDYYNRRISLYDFSKTKNWYLGGIEEDVISRMHARRVFAKSVLTETLTNIEHSNNIEDLISYITPNLRNLLPRNIEETLILNFIKKVLDDPEGKKYGIIIYKK